MDFNKELELLKYKAEQYGYDFKDGEFVKTNSGWISVMEVFMISQTICEESGRYYIFKHTYIISELDYDKITDIMIENDDKLITVDDVIFEEIDNIVYKYTGDEFPIDYIGTYDKGQIRLAYDKYRVYKESDECCDIWLSGTRDESDFPNGFISFYKMQAADYSCVDNVNLKLKKFMRDNFRWNE